MYMNSFDHYLSTSPSSLIKEDYFPTNHGALFCIERFHCHKVEIFVEMFFFTITAEFTRAHWLIFIVNMRTDTCDASVSESGQFDNLLS